MFDTTKSRGRDKGTHKTKTPTASTIVLPSKARGQLHDTLSFHGSINDAHQSIPLITPIKQKAEPKLSRSAIRRRSILAAEEAYEAANAIPVLEDFPRPLPPTIVSRTYHETIVSIRLIDPLHVFNPHSIHRTIKHDPFAVVRMRSTGRSRPVNFGQHSVRPFLTDQVVVPGIERKIVSMDRRSQESL
jgi:hypothetical protein